MRCACSGAPHGYLCFYYHEKKNSYHCLWRQKENGAFNGRFGVGLSNLNAGMVWIISIIIVAICVLLCLIWLQRKEIHELRKVIDDVRHAILSADKAYSYWIEFPYHDSCVAVYAVSEYGFYPIVVKIFPYDKFDREDKEFAIREAQELIDKLNEK